MSVFEPLEAWQRLSKKNDSAVAELLGVSKSKFSRAKRGLLPLPMKDQLELERFSGITPAQWAEFYAACVRARTAATQKKSPDRSRAVEGVL